jgi:hypothetical protein
LLVGLGVICFDDALLGVILDFVALGFDTTADFTEEVAAVLLATVSVGFSGKFAAAFFGVSLSDIIVSSIVIYFNEGLQNSNVT